jgi:MFS family permease
MALALSWPVSGSKTALSLAMSFLIGAGTACLLSGTNLNAQVGVPQVLRGRMAGLGQIAFLGGGGLSGLLAALLTMRLGLLWCFFLLGLAGLAMGLAELGRRRLRLEPA